MYLCKWSPIKFFMYLWLTILIWIFTGCQGAYTMHLSPLSSHYNNLNLNDHHQQPMREYSNNNLRHNLTKNEAFAINYSSSSSSSSNSNSNNEPNYGILSSSSNKLDEEIEEGKARDLWMVRMKQKRQTRLAHRKQLRLMRSVDHHLLLENPRGFGRNRRNSPKSSHHYPSHHNFHHNFHHNQPQPHHHQQQNHHHQQTASVQQQQKPAQNNGPKRYCSARDPQTLAFIAPIVFEGKVKSMSSDRRTHFSVTFEVIYIHKRISEYIIPTNVRLQFSRNNSECDIYKETYRERGYVREDLEQGQIYFLFVQQVSKGNFTILGQPIKKNKKTLKAVESVVSENYEYATDLKDSNTKRTHTVVLPPSFPRQHATIVSISRNITVQEGKPVRLVCKVRGQPPPKVTWYKERNPITRNNKNNKYTLVHLKKRSELTIRSAEPNDSGVYECRARNKFAKQSVSNFTKIKVTPRPTSRHTLKIAGKGKNSASGGLCPPGVSDMFCYNGGTCLLFESIKEPACQCPDGFTGMKCETKYSSVSQTLPSAPKAEDCNKKFHGGYYC